MTVGDGIAIGSIALAIAIYNCIKLWIEYLKVKNNGSYMARN
jgi:hypothetical protein